MQGRVPRFGFDVNNVLRGLHSRPDGLPPRVPFGEERRVAIVK